MCIDYVSWSAGYVQQHVVWITPFVYSVRTDELSSHNTSCAHKPVKCQRKNNRLCMSKSQLIHTGNTSFLLRRRKVCNGCWLSLSCTDGIEILINASRYSYSVNSPKKLWSCSNKMRLISFFTKKSYFNLYGGVQVKPGLLHIVPCYTKALILAFHWCLDTIEESWPYCLLHAWNTYLPENPLMKQTCRNHLEPGQDCTRGWANNNNSQSSLCNV